MVVVYFDREKKDFNVVGEGEERPDNAFYLDGFLKKKLDFAKKQQKNNFDALGLITGMEGSGKSSCAGNIMRYMTNDTFKMEHIIKDHEDAVQILAEIPDESAVMFDEGYLLFSSTEVMMKGQRDLVKVFSIIRQKKLFCLIVAPSFFRMNSYFALDRSKFLINVYTTKDGKRGRFSYFGQKKKDKLYRLGKPEHNYRVIKPDFRGTFTTCDLLESNEYRQVKKDTLNESFRIAKEKKKLSESELKQKWRDELIIQTIHLKPSEVLKVIDISRDGLYKARKRLVPNNFVTK